MWLLFKGSDYSRVVTIRGQRLFEGSVYSKKIQYAKEQQAQHICIYTCKLYIIAPTLEKIDIYICTYVLGDNFPSPLHETVEIHCIS